MQQHDKRSSYLHQWGVLFFGAVALSAAVEVVGAASLPTALRGFEDQLQHGAKDQTRFDSNWSAGRTVVGPPERLSGTEMVQTVQFIPHFRAPPEPAQGMMGPPPLPVPGPGLPHRMPPRFPPRKICLEDISRHMAIYAYIKSQLQLTDSQKAAAKTVDDAIESSAEKMRALCQTLPTEVAASPPGIMETTDFMEKELAARLDLLRALKGPMQDLFGQLSPDQRAVLDRPPPLPPFPPL